MTIITSRTSMLPLVSIIIPTRNSERTIETCLEKIKEQSYPNIEVIVVDQESQDRTSDICRKFNLKLITTPKTKIYTPPTKSRNLGSRMAQGKYLLHLDSDMELTKDLIEECVNKSENSNLGAIVIHEVDRAEGFWSLSKALERKCFVGDPSLEGARFVKKEIFDSVGGYAETLSFGEDWDIHQRYKAIATVEDVKAVIIHHIGRISLLEQVRKKYSYGKSAIRYIKRHPRESRSQLLFRRAYFRNWRLLIKDPAHTVGFILMKSCEYCATGLGLFVSLFSKG